jgi:hypothetical protein|tara:strand:- start:702 stop:950 length:249 start_codon:yes stop_codon:yes gene_type:complete
MVHDLPGNIYTRLNISTLLMINLLAAALSCSFINERIIMEQILLDKVQILEDQLGRTEDAWLKRIWEDHINDLMRKVSRLKK